MSKMSRRKGAEFELHLVKLLRPLWPDAARGLRQTRKGAECSDVEGCGDWWIEAKHRNAVDVHAAYKQACEATDGRTPVVIWRVTGARKIHVTMSAADMSRMVNRHAWAIEPVAEEVLVTLALADWMELVKETGR
jgi:hypothetical protein